MPPAPAAGSELEKLIEESARTHQRTVGRFKSNNDQQRHALEVNASKNKSRRNKTTQWSDFISETKDLDPIAYAQKLFKALVDSLAAKNVHTSRMLLRNFEWLMPNPDTTPDQLVLFDQVYTQALVVPDRDLQQIVSIELSTTSSPPTADGHHFYVRCWQMTADQFSALLSTMNKNEVWFEECTKWKGAWELHQNDPSAAFTVRYVGTCEGPKRPIDRHREDMWNKKNGMFLTGNRCIILSKAYAKLSARFSLGLLAEFYKALHEACPEVIESAKVYLLQDASLAPDSYLQPDDVERILIQLLNYDTLLNRQRGGRYTSYVPSSEDAQNFRACNTNFWTNFNAKASLPSPATTALLKSHFREVQQYANDNPGETGTASFPFTTEQRAMAIQQATPFPRNAMNVIVFIGRDQVLGEYLSNRKFIDGESHASRCIRDQMYRLVCNEAQAHQREFLVDSFNPNHSAWNFVNMWPWMWCKNLQKATEFLEQYMQIVQPLLAVSFGVTVNGVVQANFQHSHGVQLKSGITAIIGVPNIQYTEIAEDGQPAEDSAFINIPHLDPGATKYGASNLKLSRMMDLTMQYTFMIGDVALRTVDSLADDSSTIANISRKDICGQILEEVNRMCIESPAHRQLAGSLEAARNELLAEIAGSWRSAERKSKTTPIVLGPQFLLDAAGRKKTADLGKAVGKPKSAPRVQQLEHLWRKNLPDLHMIIPREDAQKTTWLADMSTVAEHQYYYLHVLGQLPGDLSTSQLLLKFRPEWATSDDWIEDKTARRKAAVNAGLWVVEQESDEDNQSGSSPSYEDFISPRECQGRLLKSDSTGKVLVRYRNEDGDDVTAKLSSHSIVPKDGRSRFMFFTELGIDILGGKGEQLRPKLVGGTNAGVTFTIRSFANDPAVVDLWKAGCAAHNISVAAMEEVPTDAREWGRAGVRMLNPRANKEGPVQNRPPEQEDANWLLQQFIEATDHLDGGGSFRTAGTDKFADSTDDMQNFGAFLRQPEYINHPYTKEWLAYLDNKNGVQVLGKNLPFIRSSIPLELRVKAKGLTVSGAPGDTAAGGGKKNNKWVQLVR